MFASLATTVTGAAATATAAATSAAGVTASAEPTGLAAIVTTVVPSLVASALPSELTTTAPVSEMVVHVPLFYEVTAAFIGGLSGAVHADERRMDISGIVTLAIANALGGGIVRDVLLQKYGIAAFQHWWLLAAALLAALFGFFFSPLHRKLRGPFLYLDALSLGLFAVVGADKALSAGLNVIPAVLLGVITSVGGGMIRDVLCGETPQIMRPGTLSATAAVLGSSLYVFLVTYLNIVKPVALVVAAATTLTIRVLAVKRGWTTPTPVHLTTEPGRPWRIVRVDELDSARRDDSHEPAASEHSKGP
ncbi:trimeric intracellular cation channel family protein [Coriobacteriia bacterium Es71-Z0120]|uniref:trimeric intracellular cation channel family protein n=1 Tax=Parvivirga hydrogeniphila TaxID=2939460 RepID=UPI002260BCB8|nr:trimeric intracellular cation channel family protein [Parvivirga hydrogeniphila]MCL4078821.1 trimeric intracellular cation channel family protein [Parvivirga hydrogeniphila]